MNKNSIIGFILIGLIFVGFTFYQSKQFEKQRKLQAQRDSVAYVGRMVQLAQDSLALAQAADSAAAGEAEKIAAATSENSSTASAESVSGTPSMYRDSSLNAAAFAVDSFITLANDKSEIVFTTRGAQPYSVRIKDYVTYDSTDLYLIKPGMSSYGISVFAGENIDTRNFVFEVAEQTDSSVSFRLPFSNGGYIEQKYILPEGSYMMHNELSFKGLDGLIPRKVNVADIDWKVIIPRLEKGYNNEKQYSKLNYYFSGENKPEQLGKGGRDDHKQVVSKVKWIAFQQQFFSAIITAGEEFSSADMALRFYKEDDRSKNLMYCTAQMQTELGFGDRNDIVLPFDFYFGPNHYRTLRQYDLKYDKIIPLGGSVIGLFSRFVIIPTFNFLGKYISNYGIIILIMTLLIKLVISPLTIKSYKSSAKMNVIKPEVDKLNGKYPKQEDAMKKQQAMMELYRKAGISPMGGCLPMLLQFPILFAMFRFFPASIELRQQSFLWADDLSAYDSILDLPFKIPMYGDHVSLFALLMAISMFLYSKMTSSQMSNDPNMAGMKFMTVWLMPIMMLFICNNLSSGLSYYYLLSNIVTMIMTWAIRKFAIDEKKILADIKAKEGKPAPKSKWQLRLEEAQRMQQQMAKEQAKKNRR